MKIESWTWHRKWFFYCQRHVTKVRFFPFIQKVLKYQIYDAHMKSLQAVINCQFLHLFDVFMRHFLMPFLSNWFSSFHFLEPNKFAFVIFLSFGTKMEMKTWIEIKVSSLLNCSAIECLWVIDIDTLLIVDRVQNSFVLVSFIFVDYFHAEVLKLSRFELLD